MTIIIDTHAHLYPEYSVQRWLECSWQNLEALSPGSEKVLVLAERASENYFARSFETGQLGGCKVSHTDEADSLKIELPQIRTLFLIRGRQIISKEGLEVLCLGGSITKPDKECSIKELIEEVSGIGGIPVVPWSFGKWTGGRKKLLASLLTDRQLHFFIGDIFGRSKVFSSDDLFSLANEHRRPVIFGSDTLPIGGEESCSGKLATEVDSHLNDRSPWLSVAPHLSEGKKKGCASALFSSLRRQIALRL